MVGSWVHSLLGIVEYSSFRNLIRILPAGEKLSTAPCSPSIELGNVQSYRLKPGSQTSNSSLIEVTSENTNAARCGPRYSGRPLKFANRSSMVIVRLESAASHVTPSRRASWTPPSDLIRALIFAKSDFIL